MAILRSYSATLELPIFGNSAVTRWRFNEDPGSTTALDSVGALDGSYLPGAEPGDPGSIGDGAARFDGASGRVVVADPPSGAILPAGVELDEAGVDDIGARTRDAAISAVPASLSSAALTSDALQLANGSIELWLTPDGVADRQILFSKNAGGLRAGDIEILLDDGAIRVGMQDATTTFNVSGGSVVEGDAAHVVFTFGAEGMNLFVNGDLVGQNAFTGGLVGNVQNLSMGARVNGSVPFDGVIDEVAMYDRALTPTEIQGLFAAGDMGPTVRGTAQSDTLIGGSDDENLLGAAGGDLMLGNGGDDVLRGGGGTDTMRGGPGDDELIGGGGGDDLAGGPGNDTLDGSGGHDLLNGGSGDDLLAGGSGTDTLNGTSGADELFGGSGVDSLSGGSGEDLLDGGAGRDRLIGGPDSDTFRIDRISDGADRIGDYTDGPGGDVLDLSAVLSFDDADDPANFVRLTETASGTRVEVNPDGAGADFTTVFNLAAVQGLDLGTLVADGNVRLEPPPAS